MPYRIYLGNKLVGETTEKTFTITGLSHYTFNYASVSFYNGIHESNRVNYKTYILTQGRTVAIPYDSSLYLGRYIRMSYQEYNLGLVPIGTEPNGMFGGKKAETIYGKVVRIENGKSIVEVFKHFDSTFLEEYTEMKKLPDGSYGAFKDYQAIYYNK